MIVETARNEAKESLSHVYRVQGGRELPRVSYERIVIDGEGELRVLPQPGKTEQTMLNVVFDDVERAHVYLRDNRPGGYIISFEVDPEFVKEVRANAIPQREARYHRGVPQISILKKTTPDFRERLGLQGHESSGYSLPAEWIIKLERAARRGTGRIIRE